VVGLYLVPSHRFHVREFRNKNKIERFYRVYIQAEIVGLYLGYQGGQGGQSFFYFGNLPLSDARFECNQNDMLNHPSSPCFLFPDRQMMQCAPAPRIIASFNA
jgi:hypothetical protein